MLLWCDATQDIPLSFDIIVENLLDPAHVPQSHSGVIVRVAAVLLSLQHAAPPAC